jgi:hypothetical protein
VELGLDCAVAIGLDDSGGKVGISIGRDDEAKVHEPAEEDLEVFEDAADVTAADLALGSGLALVDLETGADVGTLVLGEPLGVFREVREAEEECDTDERGEGALQDEDPAPGSVAAHHVHLADGGGQETAECAGKGGAAEEEGIALLSFGALVPHTDQVKAAREHAALEQAEEETGRQKPGKVLNKPLEACHQPKQEHTGRKPDMRLELLEQNIGRDLEEDVWDKKDNERVIITYSAGDVEVGFEAVDGGVGDVDSGGQFE